MAVMAKIYRLFPDIRATEDGEVLVSFPPAEGDVRLNDRRWSEFQLDAASARNVAERLIKAADDAEELRYPVSPRFLPE